MISDDEYLERIVAGIQTATTDGADVTWNETIGGRQFDVVVRFKLGTLKYLVLIEVKNQKRKTEATDMDAFASKSKDHGANKAVFVTAAGFQSGAIDVAEKHGIDLFTVIFDEKTPHLSNQKSGFILTKKGTPESEPPVIEISEPTLHANIEKIILVYASGKRARLPSEPSQMVYYVSNTTLQDGRTLDALLQEKPVFEIDLEETRKEKITIKPPQKINPPDDYFFPRGVLKAVEWTITGRMARQISGNTLIDPGNFTSPVIYKNVITGEEIQMTMDQIPLGGGVVEKGKFYFQPHPLNYFYCDGIEGNTVRWKLVESFQSGVLTTCEVKQDMKYARHFIPVTDKTIVSRLKKRLRDFDERQRKATD